MEQAQGQDILKSVEEHKTYLSVWGIDAYVYTGSTYTITVGAKCSKACSMANCEIHILDEEDNIVSKANLSNELFSDKVSMYCVELELVAPKEAGRYNLRAVLLQSQSLTDAGDATIVHQAANVQFSPVVSAKPNQSVVVEVRDLVTEKPLANAHVMLRPFSGYTDEQGKICLKVSAKSYRVSVMLDRYEDYFQNVTIDENDSECTIICKLDPSVYKLDYRGDFHRVQKRKSQ